MIDDTKDMEEKNKAPQDIEGLLDVLEELNQPGVVY